MLEIPDKETKRELQPLIAYHFHTDESSVTMLLEDLLQGSLEKFISRYQAILGDTVSYYSLASEDFYQAHWPAVRILLLDMPISLENSYRIINNREKGQGRFDVYLESREQDKPSSLFELKYTEDDSVNLKKLTMRGYEQILVKQYDHGLCHAIRIRLTHRSKRVESYTEK